MGVATDKLILTARLRVETRPSYDEFVKMQELVRGHQNSPWNIPDQIWDLSYNAFVKEAIRQRSGFIFIVLTEIDGSEMILGCARVRDVQGDDLKDWQSKISSSWDSAFQNYNMSHITTVISAPGFGKGSNVLVHTGDFTDDVDGVLYRGIRLAARDTKTRILIRTFRPKLFGDFDDPYIISRLADIPEIIRKPLLYNGFEMIVLKNCSDVVFVSPMVEVW